MKICIVLGTRPEIIKMAPVIRELQERKIKFFIIHSNQHYSESMDKIFFKELNLPHPKYNLGVGSAEHGNQTGRILMEVEKVLLEEKPDVVLSQGDTNTVLAGILAASKQNIITGHVEAGLRSYDRRMPEEKNRIICDSISDLLFAPTLVQKSILIREGIPETKIHVTGNTVVDALMQHVKLADKSNMLKKLKLKAKKYVLLTAHRSLNVDQKSDLMKLAKLIDSLSKITGFEVIYPIHPRTKAKLKEYGIKIKNARMMDPIGYLEFLDLEKYAAFIVTDSGGVQEEACALRIPCITIRENTERPETVDVGANRIVGLEIGKVKEAVAYFSKRKHDWPNPLGDGHAAKKIVDVVIRCA
jgi:UDP-N-acetylglucosamine 2-epimerase (non-hydrolysing)